jgi:hypothetical protein
MSNTPERMTHPSVASLPPDIPAEVRSFLEEMGYLEEDRLCVGDPVPSMSLEAMDGSEPLSLGAADAARPKVLVFGSYTWPPFRRQAGRLEELYHQYQDRAEFCLIYIREAHPSDGWQLDSNREQGVVYRQPQTPEERHRVASACAIGLKLTLPAYLDSIENTADRAFHGWPERLYVLSTQGRIVYQGGKGPYGFQLEELEQFLQDYLS